MRESLRAWQNGIDDAEAGKLLHEELKTLIKNGMQRREELDATTQRAVELLRGLTPPRSAKSHPCGRTAAKLERNATWHRCEAVTQEQVRAELSAQVCPGGWYDVECDA